MRLDFEMTAAATEQEVDYAVEGLGDADNHSADFSQKIQAGVKAAREGNRSEARMLLLQVADAAPDDENVWMSLASVSEYPEELLGFLANVLRINPNNERAREWSKATETLLAENFVERGAQAAEVNRTAFARQCFRQAIALKENCESAWLGLARAADSDEERSALFQRVLSFNPENETALDALAAGDAKTVELLLAKASSEAFADDYDAAEDTLEEIFDFAPDTEDAWLLKAFLVASLDEKAECWATVLRLNPKNKLARAGVAALRAFKSNLIAPPEKALENNLPEVSDDEEIKFSVEESPIENIDDAARIYAEYAVAAPDDSNSGDDYQSEPEVYEISIGEADLPAYYEAEDEFSPADKIPEESVEYFQPVEEMPETDFPAEKQVAEEAEFSASPKDESADNDEIYETANKIPCPFCSRENAPLTFVCPSCMAVLTLSDLEMLLAHSDANREIVRQSVERMEAEKEFDDFGADELKVLGIGQINLKNLRQGFLYLREAAQLNPNDVVLSSQVNALTIRVAEIEEQENIHSTMPKNKTILVVDDSATVRKLISGKLEKSGHAVLCAVDGLDAMEKIEAIVPDLVLLDINMPRMDGYQVCKMIRANEKTKDIPVVMISGKDGFFDKVRGRMAGTTGYITKPFGPETLMKTVENYIV